MPDEPHDLTLRLLEKVAAELDGERGATMLSYRQTAERLLTVHDDDDAQAAARTLLRDALSVQP
jgi:hypothetical protein